MEPLLMLVNLGANAIEPARDIASALESAVSGPVEVRFGAPVVDSPPAVAWMCGYVTARTITDGVMPLNVVAAPVFNGETTASYRSVLVGRESFQTIDSFATARLVINEHDSWSGHLVLRRHLRVADVGDRFGAVVESGSHDMSLEMLLSGAADVASIDSSVWEHHLRADTRLAGLAVIGRTADWPAPPFSTNAGLGAGLASRIRSALLAVGNESVDRVVPANLADYLPMLTPR